MGDNEGTDPITFPDFGAPEGSGIPKDAAGTPPAGEGTPPASAAPAGTPPAGPAGTTPPVTPPSDADLVSRSQFTQVHGENQQLKAQLERLTAILTGLGQIIPGLKAPAAPPVPAEPLTPEAQQDIALLKKYMPWWDGVESLVGMKDRIEKAIAKMEQVAEEQQVTSKAEQERDDAYARRSLAAVHKAIAPFYLGPGKEAKDLPEFRRQTINDIFVRWVGMDQERALRYNAYDDALVGEFVQFFEAEMVTPFKREGAVKAVAQANKVGKLPVSGATTSTLGTPPPTVKPAEGEDPLDAALKRAWAHHTAQTQSGG